MGFVYETADLAASGLDPERVRVLEERAGEAAPELAKAGFCAALDRAPAPPQATECERVVVLGIGGSALGARCVHEACGGTGRLPLVVVDNVDPEAFEAAWAGGDCARTAWVVVSKSGGTTEPLAQFEALRARLGEGGSGGGGELHVVTGASGRLRDWAQRDGLALYDVPEQVGGRFSVFTPVATVPLALAGHDTTALLAGARAAREQCLVPRSVAARFAALMTVAAEAGRSVVALWAYAERLESIGEWFRQLWAESLGKQGKGQTPLRCVGSTDQHSIQQLMVEGPPDKAVTVVAGPQDGSEMGRILEAMRRATTAAMVRAGSPAATLRLDDWGAASIGALLMTLLCSTVLAGGLWGVDPYGQPGVEAAKLATRELLAEPGGAADREIARLLGEGSGQHCP